MRTSLEGTQASGESESHAQEANVAEVSYGEPVIGEPEYPSLNHRTTRRRATRGNGPRNAPDKQVTNGVVEANRSTEVGNDRPKAPIPLLVTGSPEDLSSEGLASRPCSQGLRVTERYLRLTEKLLCEQRRNLLKLPLRGRRTGRQCLSRGSGPVVVGGVTTTQGVRESLTQGEGVYRPKDFWGKGRQH
jgi:hypothetical protein